MIHKNGLNTVEINGETIHITDLNDSDLCKFWSERQRTLEYLYRKNEKYNKSWKGIVLKLIGVHLPDNKTIRIGSKQGRLGKGIAPV